MDIVVTIPKSEYKNDDLETKDMIENDLVQFWVMNREPKKLKRGDRVYFIKNSKIESSMKVIDIKINSQEYCITTGRSWGGNCILYLEDLRYESGLESKGFQGFRYKWW